MKVILCSLGTRGDMEPFLAIGEILKEKGHHVICLFPEQFKNLVADCGLEFSSLGSEYIEMLQSNYGKIAMGGGAFGIKKMWAYIRLIQMQKSISKAIILKQEYLIETENPDRVIHNGKAIFPVIWASKKPGKTILVSPVPYLHYVKDHAHVAFNKNYGPFINKLTYKLTNYALLKTVMSSVKWLQGNTKIKQKHIQKALFENRAIYTISPTLFKRPNYWTDNIQVLGYHERKKTSNWKPSTELEVFLKHHSKIVFITFGSMVNNSPLEKTRIIIEILERNNIAAIINTASGGLLKPKKYNSELIHFEEHIPYDWIFPKMYAIIHHGGSGTTHTALKYGCASLIIPHIIDQYIWNTINYMKGCGPLGMDVSKIKFKKLEKSVLKLLNTPSYKENARLLGQQIENEDFRDKIYDFTLNA